MDKRFLIILAAIIVIFGGIFVVSKKSSGNKSGSSSSSTSQPTNHIRGNGKKGVTLIEYGDYQCPFCKQYYPIIEQLFAQYKDDIYFQFRNLPLVSLHPNAFSAARAAEAAGLQNKYWEMYAKLYQNQDNWKDSTNLLNTFTTYAQQISLNTTQFKEDYASGKVNNSINAYLAEFKKTKAKEATPTFVLNGRVIESPQSMQAFQQLLDIVIMKRRPPRVAVHPKPVSSSWSREQSCTKTAEDIP